MATMGQIEINCVDMFRSSPSPDREAGVGFASPLVVVGSDLGAGVGCHEGVIWRQPTAWSSLFPDLRTIGSGGDGADQDQLGRDVSQLTLP